ncbi:MAG: hypothetical protein DM484_29380 [Candidatus Methylumidiphilus alinenensis]|uniref:DUF1829 domain-containing protein n=1 Tax=Candidatus Methylumidiphilus alinenensis TaxID=2202197 RepID=A0A2W4S6Y2_9GAMM|nr:MAG: hypothetical protein DM484_29380 [Candidatus Methylumidiphilus alinenensis]
MVQPAILIENYYKWLKHKTSLKQVNGWEEITTPYFDRHNDYIQIYLKKKGDDFIITDDGYTITDLIQSGCAIDSPRRNALLKSTINGFGVRLSNESIEVTTTQDNFPVKTHNLIQAILAVNDLFYVAKSNVESFFFEDVALWLDECDIRYTQKVKFAGKSGYDHLFDFVIPKSKTQPDRILRILNNPSKDNAQAIAFAWIDTMELRPPKSAAFSILNDREKQITSGVYDALRNYEISPIQWSKREEFREKLAA